jgi:uridine kinase
MLSSRALKIHSLTQKRKVAIGEQRRSLFSPVVVLVSGGLFSGKKTFCRGLRNLLNTDGALFLSENFYRSGVMCESNAEASFLQNIVAEPAQFDAELMMLHIEELIAGHPILVPYYDWDTGLCGSSWQVLTPAPIIVIEGRYLLRHERLAKLSDFKVYMDVSWDTLSERCLLQCHSRESGGGELCSFDAHERLRLNYELYVEPCKRLADAVVSGEMPFETSLMELGARVLDEVFARRRKS